LATIYIGTFEVDEIYLFNNEEAKRHLTHPGHKKEYALVAILNISLDDITGNNRICENCFLWN
jgi:hypothetical protein